MKNLMLILGMVMFFGCGTDSFPPLPQVQDAASVPEVTNLSVGEVCLGDSQCASLVCTPVSCNRKVRYVCADTQCDVEKGCTNKKFSCIYAGFNISFCINKNVCNKFRQ